MNTCEWESGLKKVGKYAGITAGVYGAVRFLLPLFLPFLAAFLLASALQYFLCRIAKILKREDIKKKKAIRFFLFFVFFLLLALACLFLGMELMAQLRRLCENYGKLCAAGKEYWNGCCARVEKLCNIQTGELQTLLFSHAADFWKKGREQFAACALSGSVRSIRFLCRAGFVLLVVWASTLLIFLDYEGIVSRLENCRAKNVAERLRKRLKEAGGFYLRAQFFIWLCVSAICVGGLFLAKNPYALLAGLAVSICDALPFLGTGTIFIPWMILKVLAGEYRRAAWYLILYLACSVTRETLEPRLVGGGIGIHPVAVLMSIFIGLRVYGAAGVIFGPLSLFLILEIARMTEQKA